MPRREVRCRRPEGWGIAYVGFVDRGRAGQLARKLAELVAAAGDERDRRAARRVEARERFPDAARRAGEEDAYFFAGAAGAAAGFAALARRAISITLSSVPSRITFSPVTTYLPSTTSFGTLSIL
jgi:hypothetical protein